jgi:hypothetical protein
MAISKPWQLIRSWLRRTHNREVMEFFRDLPPNADPDNTTGRSATKAVCLVGANDSQGIAQLKMEIFRDYCQQINKVANVYSMPKADYDASFVYRPQVTCYFRQDLSAVAAGKVPVRSQISFRMMGETGETLRETEVERLAAAVRRELATAGGYRWTRGKLKVVYNDKLQGYFMQLLVSTEAEGIQVIRKILDIQNHTYESDYVSTATSKKDFPATPPKRMILQKLRTVPRQRPTATVRFTHATLAVWGLPNDIVLVGHEYAHANPIEKL